MKIAVTGASGFIGKAVCTVLAAAGHELVPIYLRFAADLRVLDSVAAVVHLAAIAHRRAATAEDLRRVNVDLAERVGRAAAAVGARMIFISSIKVHGEETIGTPSAPAIRLPPAITSIICMASGRYSASLWKNPGRR